MCNTVNQSRLAVISKNTDDLLVSLGALRIEILLFKMFSTLLCFSMRYPPYTESKLGWATWIMKENIKKKGIMSFFPFVVMGAMFGLLFKVGLARSRGLKYWVRLTFADLVHLCVFFRCSMCYCSDEKVKCFKTFRSNPKKGELSGALDLLFFLIEQWLLYFSIFFRHLTFLR